MRKLTGGGGFESARLKLKPHDFDRLTIAGNRRNTLQTSDKMTLTTVIDPILWWVVVPIALFLSVSEKIAESNKNIDAPSLAGSG